MTLNTSDDSNGSERYQRALAINGLTLQHIARAAPLVETLSHIIKGVEEQNPGIVGVILLLDEDREYLHLGAAPSLQPDACRSIEPIAIDADMGRRLAPDASLEIAAENIETGHFWHKFRGSSLQQGLYACSVTPIPSSTKHLLGIFVAYAQTPGPASAGHRKTIVDVIALASIAVERERDQARIKKIESTLHESQTDIALAIEGSGTGIWDRNIETGEIHYSVGWKAILGYADSEIGSRIEDSYSRVHPADLASVQAAIQAHWDQKTPSYKVEHRIRCKDGCYKWISSRGKVVRRDSAGKPLRMIGTTTDITAMRALSDRLQQSVDLITCLTNDVPGVVFQYRSLPDRHAFFSYVSEGVHDMYELTPEQVTGNACLVHELVYPEDRRSYRASLRASAAALTPWRLEYRVILPTQGVRWRCGDARLRRLPDGGTLWHGFITDITERKQAEIELQEFATIDFLTQLPNRRCFMACIAESFTRIQRTAGARAAVLMCDLDHFKFINDSHGHAIGDLVLQRFATILRNGLRKNDTVGRVGGEEFAVVLSDAGIEEATVFAKRIQARLDQAPLIEDDGAPAVTVSIGIALMHDTDASADVVLSRSDMALYLAKERGRNRIEMILD